MDRDAFRSDLSAVCPALCPNVETLDSALRTILDRHAPIIRRRQRSDQSAPWYASVRNDLRAAKQHRRQAERKWLKCGLTVFKEIYTAAKRKVTRIVCEAKKAFFTSKVSSCESSKQLFSVCDQLSGRVKTSPLPTIHPIKQLPSMFSDYFVSKVAKIRSDLDQQTSTASSMTESDSAGVTCLFDTFEKVSEEDIRKIIVKSKPATCSLDPIPTPLLLDCLDILLPTITHIVNQSLSSASFPPQCKTAIVKPLLKKASLDQNILKNYRPVSNLSFISKIIEKIVLKQLFEYLNSHSLLSPNQSAYRPCHSTETALLKVTNDILLALDNGDVSVLTLLDLSAAFDTVDHEILFNRLKLHFGISGAVLSWFQSYLSNRTQIVSINGCASDPVDVVFGVPQGSVLGPVLFVMYTKPLLSIIDNLSISNQSFADDTQIYSSSSPSDVQSAVNDLQSCIMDIREWMCESKLKLNDDKTEALLVHTSRSFLHSQKPARLSVGDTQVQFSSSARNLGYVLADSMSIDLHVRNICRTAYLSIRHISSIRRYLTVQATKTLVCAFVLSRLDYCNSLLAGCPKYAIDRLQKVQNSAARLVLRVRGRDHVTPLLHSLHWLPVHARVQYKLCVLCHSFLAGSAPGYFDTMLSVYKPSRQLRSSDTLQLSIPRVHTKMYGERAFAFCGPKQWNSLPASLRGIPSTPSFKRSLKTHLFKTHFKSFMDMTL